MFIAQKKQVSVVLLLLPPIDYCKVQNMHSAFVCHLGSDMMTKSNEKQSSTQRGVMGSVNDNSSY